MDFRDQSNQTSAPVSTLRFAEIEQQNTIVIIGCNVDREVPLAGIRLRKASVNGTAIFAINPADYPYHFDVTGKKIVSPQEIPLQLACLTLALTTDFNQLPNAVQKLVIGLTPSAEIVAMAEALREDKSAIVMGALCDNHPEASLIRALVDYIAQLCGARQLRLTSGANAVGGWLAGMIPHRSLAGKDVETPGLDVAAAVAAKLKGYLLMGVEPGYDFANPFLVRQSLLGAEFVVVLSAFCNESVQEYADVILPMAPYAETSGTYINVDQTWQTVKGVLAPHGESRPAWKILRVLGNILHCKGFDYVSTDDVLQEIQSDVSSMTPRRYVPLFPESLPIEKHDLVRLGEWPLYRCDPIVRHAQALQECAAADIIGIQLHPETAARLNLQETATVSQADIEITLPLSVNAQIAVDVVQLPMAMAETIDLGHAFSEIIIKR